MCALNEHINVALREHNVQQVGGAGSSPLVDTLRSLLAPNNLDAGTPPDGTQVEPDALQQLLARFQASGFADIIQSWIGTGANLPIEPVDRRGTLAPDRHAILMVWTTPSHHLAQLMPRADVVHTIRIAHSCAWP